MSYEIIEKLKRQISDFKDSAETTSVGTVVEVGDGIAKISGLSGALSQELLKIEAKSGNLPAIAFSLEENFIGAIILADAAGVSVGDSVYGTKEVLSVPVSDEIIGRVVNPLGAAEDGKGVIGGKLKNYPIERKAAGVIERKGVSVPLHTGVKAIDSMIPIGRGQRELIIGDRQTGKTSIAIDVILNQKKDVSDSRRQVKCVYVAIGQKNSKVAQIVRTLTEAGAMEYTTVVLASASHSASLQYLAPFAGSAIAEYFMDKGEDVLIIYDDLSKHADAYRQLSLLLRRSPGREAYPGDIFYLHSRLLERSARLSDEMKGGSITALPIIETKLGDVSAYVPTNVISITDGQIYLESNLFYQGIRPAVNVGLSVSRVGSSAQTKAMKKVAGKLRLELAQFRELQAFAQFASDLDENTRAKIKKGELLTEILKQTDGSPMPFENQVVLLYASLNGYLSNVPKESIKSTEKELLEFLEMRHEKDIMNPLRTSGELKEETENALKSALELFSKK